MAAPTVALTTTGTSPKEADLVTWRGELNGAFASQSEVANSGNSDDLTEGSTNLLMTFAERTKLGTVDTDADETTAASVGAAITGSTERTAMVETDKIAMVASSGTDVIWGQVTTLRAYLMDQINRLTVKTTPVGGDYVAISDSDASGVGKRVNLSAIFTWIVSSLPSLDNITEMEGTDLVTLNDNSDSNNGKNITFANLASAVFGRIQNQTNKVTLADADYIAGADSASSYAARRFTAANLAAYVFSSLGSQTQKTTPVDADYIAGTDSTAGHAGRRFTWANIKATIETHLDGVYASTQSVYGVSPVAGEGVAPLADDDSAGVGAVVLGDNMALWVDPSDGSVNAPYLKTGSRNQGVDMLGRQEIFGTTEVDGERSMLAWIEYEPGRTYPKLRMPLSFDDFSKPYATTSGLPVVVSGDNASAYLNGSTLWTPRRRDDPMVSLVTVSGVVQAVLVGDGSAPRQITYAQEDVIHAEVDGHSTIRYAEYGFGGGNARVRHAPFYREAAPLNMTAGASVSWHVPGISQSLGLGYNTVSGEVLTDHAAAPDVIKMFNGGVRPLDGQGVTSTGGNSAVLLDTDHVTSLTGSIEATYGSNTHETYATSMAWGLYNSVAGNVGDVVVSCHGFGNTVWADLRKGQAAYTNMMTAVTAHTNIATAASLTPVVPFVVMVHGEADAAETKTTYLGYLNDHLADIQSDIPTATGQAVDPFLIITQIGSASGGMVSEVALAQSEFGRTVDGGVCIGPKYQWEYSDTVHLTSENYMVMGDMISKFAAQKMAGKAAQPMRLESVERVEQSRLRLKFYVPVLPMSLDGMGIVTDPGNYGIEIYRDTGGGFASVTINTIRQETENTLLVDVAPTLVGYPVQARVAMQNLSSQGPTTGPRSTIHDSDNTVGARTGEVLVNWCEHSLVEIPA